MYLHNVSWVYDGYCHVKTIAQYLLGQNSYVYSLANNRLTSAQLLFLLYFCQLVLFSESTA